MMERWLDCPTDGYDAYTRCSTINLKTDCTKYRNLKSRKKLNKYTLLGLIFLKNMALL